MLKFTPFPTWVTYSDNIPEGVGGYAKLCYERIRPKYKDIDVGIHKHEDLHVTQWYLLLLAWIGFCSLFVRLVAAPYDVVGYMLMPIGILIHPLLYTYVKEYKLACEVDCYQEQAKHYPDDRLPRFAGYISKDYGLKISEEAALKLLRS